MKKTTKKRRNQDLREFQIASGAKKTRHSGSRKSGRLSGRGEPATNINSRYLQRASGDAVGIGLL